MSDRPAAAAQAPTGPVFLGYASEDTAAAERIATVLRSVGIEVWFDRTELRGGDLWERQIEDRIHDCRLFILLISVLKTDSLLTGLRNDQRYTALVRNMNLPESP